MSVDLEHSLNGITNAIGDQFRWIAKVNKQRDVGVPQRVYGRTLETGNGKKPGETRVVRTVMAREELCVFVIGI